MDCRAERRPTEAERQEVALEMFLSLMTAHQQAFEVLFDDVVAKHLASAASRLLSRFGVDPMASPAGRGNGTAQGGTSEPARGLGDKEIDNAA